MRVEIQAVQCSLDLRAHAHGILGRRKLEKGMDLKACASAQRVFDGDSPRADVAGRREVERHPGDGPLFLREPQGRQHAEIAVAQLGAAVGDAAVALEDAAGVEQPVAVDEVIGAVPACGSTSTRSFS